MLISTALGTKIKFEFISCGYFNGSQSFYMLARFVLQDLGHAWVTMLGFWEKWNTERQSLDMLTRGTQDNKLESCWLVNGSQSLYMLVIFVLQDIGGAWVSMLGFLNLKYPYTVGKVKERKVRLNMIAKHPWVNELVVGNCMQGASMST